MTASEYSYELKKWQIKYRGKEYVNRVLWRE